jgi:hypothetical protein
MRGKGIMGWAAATRVSLSPSGDVVQKIGSPDSVSVFLSEKIASAT